MEQKSAVWGGGGQRTMVPMCVTFETKTPQTEPGRDVTHLTVAHVRFRGSGAEAGGGFSTDPSSEEQSAALGGGERRVTSRPAR